MNASASGNRHSDPPDLLTGLLEQVSRSFYLTLRVLPGRIRGQIGLAYLLARASDTIADTEAVALEKRLNALRRFRAKLTGNSSEPLDLGELRLAQATAGESALLQRMEEAFQLLESLSIEDKRLVIQVLETIVSGQELDLVRFGQASAREIAALRTEEELDDYTYRVAGCVGEFWTRLCRAHLFPGRKLEEQTLIEQGIQFGKGLQMVNILRDIPADLRKGRCYLPLEKLSAIALVPEDLLDPASESKLRPLYDSYLERTGHFLDAAWRYTLALPYTQARLRLACAWPVLIGRRTLEQLSGRPFLDPDQRVKITRSEVKQILFFTVLAYPIPWIWKRL
jgi:farnesyl-diphosphate farnesyltransferase